MNQNYEERKIAALERIATALEEVDVRLDELADEVERARKAIGG